MTSPLEVAAVTSYAYVPAASVPPLDDAARVGAGTELCVKTDAETSDLTHALPLLPLQAAPT
jgi:hypothetical protein